MRSVAVFLVGVFYWPLALIACLLPLGALIAVSLMLGTARIDVGSWALPCLVLGGVIFLGLNATWDHAVRPWMRGRLHG